MCVRFVGWVWLLAVGSAAFGQNFTGAATGELVMDIGGSYGSFDKLPIGAVDFQTTASLAPTPNAITFDHTSYDTDALQLQLADDFSVQLGQVVHVTTTVTFDPVYISAQAVGPLTITPETGAIYDIQDYRGNDTMPVFSDYTLTGTWAIQGPTEQATGNFSLPYTQSAINARFPDFQLDGNTFPASFKLLSTGYSLVGYGNGPYGPNFGTTVDGVFIWLDLRGMFFMAPDTPMTIPGDLDLDGFVGLADLNVILSYWNTDASIDPRADTNGDGFVGIEDLNYVLGHWNAGTPPPAATVPEPASTTLFIAAALLWPRRRSRKRDAYAL